MCIGIANAQVYPWQTTEDAIYSQESNNADATIDDGSVYIPESLEENADSLLQSWHIDYYAAKDKNCGNYDQNLYTSDEIIKQRLSKLPRIMEMAYNEPVKSFIELYTERRRPLVQYMLGMADFYFPMFEQVLDEYDLPLELKYLAIVESALNPTAVSRAGATGLWQFMLPTGKAYSLEINSLVDERRDPLKSTHAACRYLRDMYNIYGDWNLVIAAYNCGPGNINKAIRRAGGKKDYWAIYNYLPRETRSYVPLFIAANYVMNYYKEHNICPVRTDLPMSTDTIMINKALHLDQVAEVLRIDKDQLRGLNPQYKKDIIPGNCKAYPLRLPSTYSYAFIDAGDEIYKYRSDELLTNRSTVEPGGYSSSSSSQEKMIHRVKKGETLAQIARNYGVTTTQLKRWNGLKSTKVTKGKRLVIYSDSPSYSYNSNNDGNKSNVSSGKKKSETNSTSSTGYKKYKVRKGDSFYSIAKKYPGTEARELMRLNNLTSSGLKVGQIIKIPVG